MPAGAGALRDHAARCRSGRRAMTPAPTRGPLLKLTLGAIGIVYGDIGTSPLYVMKESFAGAHPLALDEAHVFGVLSLIFWSVTAVVTVKYLAFMMRADNNGEGGSLALLALVTRIVGSGRRSFFITVLGIFAAALFYGDSMLTPAISVLSAVEGLEFAIPGARHYVVAITLAILVALFLVQSHGTARVGAFFGPIMCLWFLTLAVLGVVNMVDRPDILLALDPRYAVHFFIVDQWKAFLALGSVFLALTGAEALYADMGHFGKRPIRLAWFAIMLPALMLNYMGQGALLLQHPDAVANPFYSLAPGWAVLPMVVLATMAAVIASQAVISGAFSVTRQAIQLGYLPRMRIVHTSAREIGQVYVPFVNWMLLAFIVALVLGFRSSNNLAAAYGVAVNGTMAIDSVLLMAVVVLLWRWSLPKVLAFGTLLAVVDLSFFISNATKIPYGGWFPLVVGLLVFILLTTWKKGRALLAARMRAGSLPVDLFLQSARARLQGVGGTAVFLTNNTEGVPSALLHNVKHNRVLHERVLLLTVLVEQVPHIEARDRLEVQTLAPGFFRVFLRYGFQDDPDVPEALAISAEFGPTFNLMDTSFFLTWPRTSTSMS
jgi:KUP system potassium uptake protein